MGGDEANALFEYVAVLASTQLEGLNTADERQVMTHLHHLYGHTAADAMVTAARKTFATLRKDVQAWLAAPDILGQRLTNSPAVISLLALYGSGYSRLSPEAAAKELETLRKGKGYLAGDALTRDKAVKNFAVSASHEISSQIDSPTSFLIFGFVVIGSCFVTDLTNDA